MLLQFPRLLEAFITGRAQEEIIRTFILLTFGRCNGVCVLVGFLHPMVFSCQVLLEWSGPSALDLTKLTVIFQTIGWIDPCQGCLVFLGTSVLVMLELRVTQSVANLTLIFPNCSSANYHEV